MFDWRLGYEYGLTYFEEQDFQSLSNTYNQVNTRGRWRFLPRTAFLYDAYASRSFATQRIRAAHRSAAIPIRFAPASV